MKTGKINLYRHQVYIMVLAAQAFLFCSCEQKTKQKESRELPKFEMVTISLDISGKNCLAILLNSDGTVNRKGSEALDTSDRNFFMGVTKDNLVDSLMNGLPNDLFDYCGAGSPVCEVSKPYCTIKIMAGDNSSVCKIEHCVNGTFNDMPNPIKEFIKKAMRVTDGWYRDQTKKLTAKR